jgi:beta-aspartyl-peptidase (threonine type)
VRYGGRTLARAVEDVVLEELPAIGGEGGVIAIDRSGRVQMEFNSEGMFRASRVSGGSAEIGIYRAPEA